MQLCTIISQLHSSCFIRFVSNNVKQYLRHFRWFHYESRHEYVLPHYYILVGWRDCCFTNCISVRSPWPKCLFVFVKLLLKYAKMENIVNIQGHPFCIFYLVRVNSCLIYGMTLQNPRITKRKLSGHPGCIFGPCYLPPVLVHVWQGFEDELVQ